MYSAQPRSPRTSSPNIKKVTNVQRFIDGFEVDMRSTECPSFITRLERSGNCNNLRDIGPVALPEIAVHLKKRYPNDRDTNMRDAWWLLLGKMQFTHTNLARMPSRGCNFSMLTQWVERNSPK